MHAEDEAGWLYIGLVGGAQPSDKLAQAIPINSSNTALHSDFFALPGANVCLEQ